MDKGFIKHASHPDSYPVASYVYLQARSKHKMTGGAERVVRINSPPPPLRSLD